MRIMIQTRAQNVRAIEFYVLYTLAQTYAQVRFFTLAGR